MYFWFCFLGPVVAVFGKKTDPCDPDNPNIKRRPDIPSNCSLTRELLNLCGTDGYCYYGMRQLNCAAKFFEGE